MTVTSPMMTTPSLRQPDQTTDEVDVVPRSPEETVTTDGGRPMFEITSLEVKDMDITTPEQDIYHGIYPVFQLPLPNRPCISDLFAGNT